MVGSLKWKVVRGGVGVNIVNDVRMSNLLLLKSSPQQKANFEAEGEERRVVVLVLASALIEAFEV